MMRYLKPSSPWIIPSDRYRRSAILKDVGNDRASVSVMNHFAEKSASCSGTKSEERTWAPDSLSPFGDRRMQTTQFDNILLIEWRDSPHYDSEYRVL